MNAPESSRPWFVPVFFALGCLPTGLLGCKRNASGPELTETVPATSSLDARGPTPLPDSDIAQAIDRHFQDEGLLRSEHLKVVVTQGTAILSGVVSSLMAKERALDVTGMIKGVRAITDQVTVTAVSRTDQQLKSEVAVVLQNDMATRTHTIAVAALDGTVTLSGTADSWQQQKMFADVAKAVPGVQAVNNAVSIQYSVSRTDSEVLADVEHRVDSDIRLDGDRLGVTLIGHTVHLSGVVASVAQKARAHSDGWVVGVDAVDDEGIVVDWSAEQDQRDLRDYVLKSDAQVLQAVRDALQLDPRLKTLVPQVAVYDGAVVLSGLVADPKARGAAEADARDTVGVWSVRDEVLVQPGGKPTDADIARAIKRVLAQDAAIPNGKSIQVSSANGKVELGGTVASAFDRANLIADVDRVPGVAEVDDRVIIERPPAEIEASIEERMSWDPMVRRARVTVAVSPDGDATLTGTLDSWGEIRAATQDALRGGAARVINMLKLKNHPELGAGG